MWYGMGSVLPYEVCGMGRCEICGIRYEGQVCGMGSVLPCMRARVVSRESKAVGHMMIGCHPSAPPPSIHSNLGLMIG